MIMSIVLLALVCSAAAFSIMVALVGEVGPVRATTVTYVNPAVALIAGAVVLGEPVTAWSVVGFALILAGCYLVAARQTGSRDEHRASLSSLVLRAVAPVAENQARSTV